MFFTLEKNITAIKIYNSSTVKQTSEGKIKSQSGYNGDDIQMKSTDLSLFKVPQNSTYSTILLRDI